MDDINFISPMLGIVVGLLLGLASAGGATLAVPLLVFGLNLGIAQAGPIALLSITLSAGIGALMGLKQKILRYRAAVLMSIFGLLFFPLGLWLAQKIPNTALLFLFGILLLFISIRLYIEAIHEAHGTPNKNIAPSPCQLNESIGSLIWTSPCAMALAMAGLVAGFLSGLLGIGGGFIIVPALKKFSNLPIKSIAATSLGVLAIISGVGTLMSAMEGNIPWVIAMPFAVGSVFGLLVGKILAKRCVGPRIQQLFSISAFMVALSLVYRGIF
jgi:uncharacterized membrane protein YfcA